MLSLTTFYMTKTESAQKIPQVMYFQSNFISLKSMIRVPEGFLVRDIR